MINRNENNCNITYALKYRTVCLSFFFLRIEKFMYINTVFLNNFKSNFKIKTKKRNEKKKKLYLEDFEVAGARSKEHRLESNQG